MQYTLTADQQNGYAEIMATMTSPDRNVLVICGGAGVGKTTLVNTFFDEWQQLCAVSGGAFKDVPIHLTATTNKAADALAAATGRDTGTIHALLGLRVKNTGFRKTELIDTGKPVEAGCLVVIDEASFIDAQLLQAIQAKTRNCKVIYLGDPCQLKPVGAHSTPVFEANYPTVFLNEIVRQKDTSPIQALSRNLRAYVDGTALIPNAGVDGVNIHHMNQAAFEQALIAANKVRSSVRALTWTNQKAIHYNNLVAQALSGTSDIKLGDILVVNKQVIHGVAKYKLPTESTVEVVGISKWYVDSNGITVRDVEISRGITLRVPKDMGDTVPIIKAAYDKGRADVAYVLENLYVDLRHMYGSTVNKSQGSTYHTVFIDLSDIGACKDRDQVKRMLYVAASRASDQVVFTGDI